MTDLHFNWIGFDQRRKSVLFACREAVEYKAVKLETSSTIILPPGPYDEYFVRW